MSVGILVYGDSACSFSEAVNCADGCELVMIGGRNVAAALTRGAH